MSLSDVGQSVLLTVVIVSFNCNELVRDCVESIYDHNDLGEALEVIIVDNGDKENVVDIAHDFPATTKVVKSVNRGFGYGNNVGFGEATGDIVLFLNPDTVLLEPVFRFAIDQFMRDERLGCFGVKLVDETRGMSTSFGIRNAMGFASTMANRALVSLRWFIPAIMFTSGADLFVRATAFEQAGMFDSDMFMYCEESDLIERINSKGYTNAYFPEKTIMHLEGKATSADAVHRYQTKMASYKVHCKKCHVDYNRELRKERRYCNFKQFCLQVAGKQEMAESYRRIVIWIDDEMNKHI